jgi:acyl-CoA hydrolase
MTEKRVSDSRIMLSQLMGPADANLRGNVHGGVLMKLCDEAGAMAASKFARRPTVTVAVDSMSFHSPVQLGDLVTVLAEVTWTGRSSLEARAVVSAENVLTGEVTHTNTAYLVYVALGDDGRPTTVPSLILETVAERQRFERAAARQAHRLALRQQEKKG